MTQYTRNPPLLEDAMPDDPLRLFERWLADAVAAGMIEPGAMTLATVDTDGQPSARVLLFKGLHQGALSFYTHYASRKAAALAAHPLAAATFWWDRLERSVRFEGQVEKLPEAVSREYFHSRPRGSQVGAWSSTQSQPIESREALDARLAEQEQQLAGQDPVPLPPFWGGYALKPARVEFWQGRLNRLHDRLRYQRNADGAGWALTRLQP
jgi:pyridoxamine 5'-phosphate oxidase